MLTLDFSTVGRAFGVPILPPGDLLDSLSKDGKSGVPGGVRSLEKGGHLQNSIKGQYAVTNFNMIGNQPIPMVAILGK